MLRRLWLYVAEAPVNFMSKAVNIEGMLEGRGERWFFGSIFYTLLLLPFVFALWIITKWVWLTIALALFPVAFCAFVAGLLFWELR